MSLRKWTPVRSRKKKSANIAWQRGFARLALLALAMGERPALLGAAKKVPRAQHAARAATGSSGGRAVTTFEQRAYALCQQVPAGSVATYGELARYCAGEGGREDGR